MVRDRKRSAERVKTPADLSLEFLSSDQNNRNAHRVEKRTDKSNEGNDVLEIGRGFRDQIDRDINPADMSESEATSSAYIPRACQKFMAAEEKDLYSKQKSV